MSAYDPRVDPGASASVPFGVRLEFAHAAVCRLAALAGADVLVIKGPAMHPLVAAPGRGSTDVDVLVRPAQLDAFLRVLSEHGWSAVDSFATGSPFGHSTTFSSPVWGYADVHRLIPGFEAPADVVFDRLWEGHTLVGFAGHDAPVPEPAAQGVILVLHAARSGGEARARADLAHAWEAAPPEHRARMLALVTELEAEVAWAAATGDLERFRTRSSYGLWRAVSTGGGRVAEWSGRVRAATGLGAKARLVGRMVLVNTDHLALQLGRPPRRREVVAEFVRRARAGTREIVTGGRARLVRPR